MRLCDFMWNNENMNLTYQLPEDMRERLETEAERFLRWADNHNRDVPIIPLSKMSREYLYEERG
jgi:hypothetical protein